MSKPEVKIPLPRRILEYNITMELDEVGLGTWTRLIWFRIGAGGGLL